jgi:hypothetical protein
MKKTSEQFLNLLFNPGETICVSPDKYGYHSINQQDLNENIKLHSPNKTIKDRFIKEGDINLVAINPISGFREDKNVTAYRTFMVEMDDGTLDQQRKYIKNSGLPYSVCVFSGNKSLHYGIVLKEDLPESVWRCMAEWILNILDKSDQSLKTPSRSIRFPGNYRKNGKKQSLVEIKGRIDNVELDIWLNKHLDKKPKEEKIAVGIMPIGGIKRIPFYVQEKLENGINIDRNVTWFSLACSMYSSGYEEDYTLSYFIDYFEPERDFTQKEWETCIKSAFKYMRNSDV